MGACHTDGEADALQAQGQSDLPFAPPVIQASRRQVTAQPLLPHTDAHPAASSSRSSSSDSQRPCTSHQALAGEHSRSWSWPGPSASIPMSTQGVRAEPLRPDASPVNSASNALQDAQSWQHAGTTSRSDVLLVHPDASTQTSIAVPRQHAWEKRPEPSARVRSAIAAVASGAPPPSPTVGTAAKASVNTEGPEELEELARLRSHDAPPSEVEARFAQGSPRWQRARARRITASSVSAACGLLPRCGTRPASRQGVSCDFCCIFPFVWCWICMHSCLQLGAGLGAIPEDARKSCVCRFRERRPQREVLWQRKLKLMEEFRGNAATRWGASSEALALAKFCHLAHGTLHVQRYAHRLRITGLIRLNTNRTNAMSQMLLR